MSAEKTWGGWALDGLRTIGNNYLSLPSAVTLGTGTIGALASTGVVVVPNLVPDEVRAGVVTFGWVVFAGCTVLAPAANAVYKDLGMKTKLHYCVPCVTCNPCEVTVKNTAELAGAYGKVVAGTTMVAVNGIGHLAACCTRTPVDSGANAVSEPNLSEDPRNAVNAGVSPDDLDRVILEPRPAHVDVVTKSRDEGARAPGK